MHQQDQKKSSAISHVRYFFYEYSCVSALIHIA